MSLSLCFKPRYALLALPLALTACGGGGGGGSSSPNFVADRPIAITVANTPQVVDESSTASDTDLNSALGPLGATFRMDASNTDRVKNLRASVDSLVGQSLASAQAGARTATVTDSYACSLSGSVSITFSGDINENTGNGSISGTISANNCSESPGEVIDGSMSISGNLVAEELSGPVTAVFDDFSVETSEGSGSINGTMRITETVTGSYEEFRLDASDCAFSVTDGTDRVTLGAFTLVERDYSTYTTEDLDFTVNSSRLGGSFRYDTVDAFVTDLLDNYPYQGQALISGENNAKIRITAQGSGEATGLVLVETDADGDGTYENSQTYTWTEIDDGLS